MDGRVDWVGERGKKSRIIKSHPAPLHKNNTHTFHALAYGITLKIVDDGMDNIAQKKSNSAVKLKVRNGQEKISIVQQRKKSSLFPPPPNSRDISLHMCAVWWTLCDFFNFIIFILPFHPRESSVVSNLACFWIQTEAVGRLTTTSVHSHFHTHHRAAAAAALQTTTIHLLSLHILASSPSWLSNISSTPSAGAQWRESAGNCRWKKKESWKSWVCVARTTTFTAEIAFFSPSIYVQFDFFPPSSSSWVLRCCWFFFCAAANTPPHIAPTHSLHITNDDDNDDFNSLHWRLLRRRRRQWTVEPNHQQQQQKKKSVPPPSSPDCVRYIHLCGTSRPGPHDVVVFKSTQSSLVHSLSFLRTFLFPHLHTPLCRPRRRRRSMMMMILAWIFFSCMLFCHPRMSSSCVCNARERRKIVWGGGNETARTFVDVVEQIEMCELWSLEMELKAEYTRFSFFFNSFSLVENPHISRNVRRRKNGEKIHSCSNASLDRATQACCV